MVMSLEEQNLYSHQVLSNLDRESLIYNIQSLYQRATQVEEIVGSALIPKEILIPIIEKHLKERDLLRSTLLYRIIQNAITALEDVAKSPNTNSVNRIVDSLKLVVNAESLSKEEVKSLDSKDLT